MTVRNTWWVTLAVFAACGSAQADVIFATGFENPPYTNNSQLVGQQGWVAPAFLSPNAAVISTVLPRSGLQGVQVSGANLQSNPTVNAAGYAGVGSYRQPVGFDALAAGLPVVRAQADVRLNGPGTTQTSDRVTGDFASANLALTSDDGILGEISLSADGHVYGYGPGDNDVYLFGAAAALNTYHNLAVEANFQDRTVSFFLDGGLLGQLSFADPSLGYSSSVVNRGSLLMYANLPNPLVPQTPDQYTAFYDNFSITATATPEPTSVAAFGGLLAVGGLALRRRSGRGSGV